MKVMDAIQPPLSRAVLFLKGNQSTNKADEKKKHRARRP